MLLDVRGIDVDKGSHQKWTALMRASWHGNTEIVAALLAANANPNMKNKRGGTALTYATLRNHPEVAAMLREAGAGAGATR
jgi:hypothetical protein